MGLLSKNSGSIPDYSLATGGAQEGIQNGLKNANSFLGLHEKNYKNSREHQFNDAWQKAWQKGDNNALEQLMGQYTEFVPQMQKALGLKDDQHNQHVGSLMMKLNSAVNLGDTNAARQLVKDNPDLITPDAAKLWEKNLSAMDAGDAKAKQAIQQRLDGYTKGMIRASFKNPMQMMSSLLTEGRQNETEWRDRARNILGHDRLGYQDRWHQERNQLGWANHNERQQWHNRMTELKQQGLLNASSGDAMTDMNGNPLSSFDYNRKVLQSGVDPHTGKRATTAQLGAAQKWMKGNQAFTSAQQTLEQQVGKLDELLSGDNLSAGTGRLVGRLPDAAVSSQGQNTRNLIKSIQSGEFVTNVQKMRGMGALSNAEGSKLMDLTAKIDPTQDESIIRKQLVDVHNQYKKLQDANLQDAADMGYGQSVINAYRGKKGDISDMSDDDLLEGL